MRTIMALFFSIFLSTEIHADNTTTQIIIEHWQTKNGAPVYFVRSPIIPIVDVQVVFTAGSAYDGKKSGLASFVNSMLGEGTKTHNADQISNTFDSVGAQFSQEVDQDMAAVRLRSLLLPKYLNPALKMLGEVLTQPSFSKTPFQRIKQQTLTEIKMGEQMPGVIAAEAFFRLIYRDHPYAHPLTGDLVSVERMLLQDIKIFYQRYYVAKNAKIIIVGDITRATAENIAEQVMGRLPQGEPAPLLSMADNTQQSAYQFIHFPAKQDTIIMGEIAIPAGDPNRFPLVVGNEVLGGAPLSSILFNEVRSKRGFVYQVTSQFSPLKYRGPFYIQLQSRVDQAKSAMQVSEQVLQNFVQNGPTVEQLNRAKKNMIGNFPLQISSNASILDVITTIAFYGLPLDYLNTYLQKIAAVNVDEVKNTFQKIINVSAIKIVVVGSGDPIAKTSVKSDEK